MPGLFRRYPFLVATAAASGGVLLGAYLVFQIFAAPVEQRGALAPPQPVARTNATATNTRAPAIAPAPATAETTGSAPTNDDLGSADHCVGQTWPNLTRDCMGQMQGRKSSRTVSTDPAVKPAPRAPHIASAPSNDTAAASAPAAALAASQAPAAATPQPSNSAQAAVPPEPAAHQEAAAPTNAPAAAETKSAKDSAKSEKRKVKEAKRKAKKPKPEDESDDRAFAYAPNSDRDNAWGNRSARDERTDRRNSRGDDRADRSRRERVIVRGEDDDGGDRMSGRGDRRVIVIRRDREGGFGGGVFENLFGN